MSDNLNINYDNDTIDISRNIILEIIELGDNDLKTVHIKPNKQTICLNMIVKNEEDIIKNTLENLYSKIQIDYWVICDTGSTDNTKQIITDFFKEKEIPGELHDEPWKDFGYNRTKALELAYKKTDFLLHFDADDRITGDLILPKPLQKGVGYHMQFGSGVGWKRMPLVDNHIKWHYEGVMHEIISTKEPFKSILITGKYHIATNVEVSARNKKGAQKFLEDAKILEEAFDKKDHLKNRYCFYCAECYRFAGEWEKSIEWYKKDLTLNGWSQEKYWACLQLGDLYSKHNQPEKAFYYYVRSYEYDDNRQEAYYKIIHTFRNTGKHKLAVAFYKQLKPVVDKINKLFCINHIYDYSLDIELTISCFYAKEFEIAIGAFERIFQNSDKIPNNLLTLTISNLDFYLPYITSKNTIFYENFNKFLNVIAKRKIIFPESRKNKIENIFK